MLRKRFEKSTRNTFNKDSKTEETSLAALLVKIAVWFCILGTGFYFFWELNKPPHLEPQIFQEVSGGHKNKKEVAVQSIPQAEESKDVEPSGACEWQVNGDGSEDTWYPGWCEGMQKVPSANAAECKKKCCDDPDCAKWQYRDDDLGCRHRTDLGGYCEIIAPQPWTGFKLKSRNDGKCEWNTKEQRGQCMGFGPRKKAYKDKESCQEACCETTEPKACQMWQWRDDVGCFFGRASYCQTQNEDNHAFDPFQGGKKVGYKQTGRMG